MHFQLFFPESAGYERKCYKCTLEVFLKIW